VLRGLGFPKNAIKSQRASNSYEFICYKLMRVKYRVNTDGGRAQVAETTYCGSRFIIRRTRLVVHLDR